MHVVFSPFIKSDKRRVIFSDFSTSTVAGLKSHYSKVEKFSKKSFARNYNQNMVSAVSENKVTNILIINVNVVQASRTPSFREIYPKPNVRATKSTQTDCMKCCDKTLMCHAGSQTTQWNTYEQFTPGLHKCNDFHCQTHIAKGVECGTQIYPEDVSRSKIYPEASSDINVKHNKTQNDFELEDIWRHIETQTSAFVGNDALTQTAIDFMNNSSMTDWDLLI